jgi:hyperosmotically inducible protein
MLTRHSAFHLLSGLLVLFALSPAAVSAKHDKDHNDAFVNGPVDESRIAQDVRRKLLGLPYYGVFDDLAFRVDGPSVTLMGAVTNPTLKIDAEREVKRVEGVTNVVNKIELLPLSTIDDRIRMAEYRAIYGDPVISTRYGYRAIPPIHIIVKNGNVTLEGVVANQMDRNVINIRANAVPGVFSVTNDLLVEGA